MDDHAFILFYKKQLIMACIIDMFQNLWQQQLWLLCFNCSGCRSNTLNTCLLCDLVALFIPIQNVFFWHGTFISFSICWQRITAEHCIHSRYNWLCTVAVQNIVFQLSWNNIFLLRCQTFSMTFCNRRWQKSAVVKVSQMLLMRAENVQRSSRILLDVCSSG